MSGTTLPLLQLCLISDGKAGHNTQLRGLQSGLSRHFHIAADHIETTAGFLACVSAIKRWRNQIKNQRLLVAGAGGGTWRYLVMANKLFGLRTLVLLRPRFWPKRWFDYIVVPKHDELPERGHIFCTEGVLNPISPAKAPDVNKGTILIGGPSKHHDWDSDALLEQIKIIMRADAHTHWSLTTSRRTPMDFGEKLKRLDVDNLTFLSVDETPPNWVSEQLNQCAAVWVTEDSMSMIFEGLSAGARVGLMALPRSRTGRVTRCIDDLVQRGWVTSFTDFKKSKTLLPPKPPLQEANRIGDIIAAKIIAGE